MLFPSPKQIVIQEGDPELEGVPPAMRFRLFYEGRLLGATQSSPRAEHKQEIRKAFHPQLKRLWEMHPTFMGMGWAGGSHSDPAAFDYHPEDLAKRFTAGNYGFAPLVMEDDRALVD